MDATQCNLQKCDQLLVTGYKHDRFQRIYRTIRHNARKQTNCTKSCTGKDKGTETKRVETYFVPVKPPSKIDVHPTEADIKKKKSLKTLNLDVAILIMNLKDQLIKIN